MATAGQCEAASDARTWGQLTAGPERLGQSRARSIGFRSLGRLRWASCDDRDAQDMDNSVMRHIIEVVLGFFFSLEMMVVIVFKRCYLSDLVT